MDTSQNLVLFTTHQFAIFLTDIAISAGIVDQRVIVNWQVVIALATENNMQS